MNEQIFQDVFDIVYPILPDDWTGFVVRGLFSRDGSEIKIFIRDSSNTYHDCSTLGIPNEDVLFVAESVHEKFLNLRQSPEKEPWTAITMKVDKDGNFTSDFDYSDIKLFSPEYDYEWEKRYLK